MKNIKYITIILLLSITFSCDDFIDLQPENAVTYTNAFNTPQEMEAMLSTGQATLQGILTSTSVMEIAGAYVNGMSQKYYTMPSTMDIRSHNWSGGMVPIGSWQGHYALIGYANIITSNIKENWSDDMKNYFIGQAEFLKAISYFQLGRDWGEAPIVPDNDYESPKVAKSSNAEVLQTATNHALKAFEHCVKYENLFFTDKVKVNNKQYANKEICAALLAHIYAWRGGVEENATEAMKQEYWTEAEKYASMLIDGNLQGYASLEPSIKSMVDNTLNSRHGMESIFELEYDTRYTKKMHKAEFVVASKLFGYPYKYGAGQNDVPELTLSCKLVNDMYGAEGTTDERKEIYFPKTDSLYDSSVELNLPDQPITVEWVEPFPGWKFPRYTGGLPEQAPNRAYFKKFYKQFIYTDNPDTPKSFYNFDTNKVIWRLADIILLRAEVRNFLGKEQEAVNDLNTIRTRAKAPLYPSSQDNQGLQMAIFKEREKELIYENHRWFDIRRNKDYYKTQLPANFRIITDEDVKEGALYYPVVDDAGDYNSLMTPNKYWYKRQN